MRLSIGKEIQLPKNGTKFWKSSCYNKGFHVDVTKRELTINSIML